MTNKDSQSQGMPVTKPVTVPVTVPVTRPVTKISSNDQPIISQSQGMPVTVPVTVPVTAPVTEISAYDQSNVSQSQEMPVTVNIGGKTFNTYLASKKDIDKVTDKEGAPDKEPAPDITKDYEKDKEPAPDKSGATNVSPSKDLTKVANDLDTDDLKISTRLSSQHKRKEANRKERAKNNDSKGQLGKSDSPLRGKKKS